MTAPAIQKRVTTGVITRWVVVGAIAAVIVLGWSAASRIPVRGVVVHGAAQADVEAILELARVPVDSSLFSVSASMVADRVLRHPWVADARVSRLPTGTVSIRVAERIPVLLALSQGGEPAYYVDAAGYRMPFRPGGPWRVPILTGLRERYHPVARIRSAAVRNLAAALPALDDEVDALLSEFHVDRDGGLLLRTAVTPSGRTLTIRLGAAAPGKSLSRLRPFWDQVVLTRPDVRFTWVDLRFDSQIVTKES
jgi:hypothetical protein